MKGSRLQDTHHTITMPTEVPLGGLILKEPGRRQQRVTGSGDDCSQFHVMSRTAGGQKIFQDAEKEAFRALMWRMSRFSGVEILTYCLMENHFHLLVRIPKREQFLKRFECDEPGGEGELRLIEHLRLLYSANYIKQLEIEISALRSRGREDDAQLLFNRYKKRFCDLSLFVKELKERFSRWFNKKHSRRGTLWMDRFRSVLVEDGKCLQTMAAYIDLNPVRAGLVARPEDYRWCGYSEALAGSKRMRRGLCRTIGWPIDGWSNAGIRIESGSEAYRCLLYETGLEDDIESGRMSPKKRGGLTLTAVREVIGNGGKIDQSTLLYHRIRWFSEGYVLGSKEFLREALDGDLSGTRPLPLNSGDGHDAPLTLSRLRKRGLG